jgi:hypothetical protein
MGMQKGSPAIGKSEGIIIYRTKIDKCSGDVINAAGLRKALEKFGRLYYMQFVLFFEW